MPHYDERLRGLEDRLGSDPPERTGAPGRNGQLLDPQRRGQGNSAPGPR